MTGRQIRCQNSVRINVNPVQWRTPEPLDWDVLMLSVVLSYLSILVKLVLVKLLRYKTVCMGVWVHLYRFELYLSAPFYVTYAWRNCLRYVSCTLSDMTDKVVQSINHISTLCWVLSSLRENSNRCVIGDKTATMLRGIHYFFNFVSSYKNP